ncbi:hypothetical protein [Amycolatopsis sp. NPDC059657]|uniref:hypothetical protein n=1 Tax=Amycolatopsis sp. NPDC059657 TaxID=3346899 RepID=UPI00366BD6F2
MSMPMVPGYTSEPQRGTLADLWQRPAGDYPDELWPEADLRTVTANPVEWLVVEEHFFTDDKHGGRGCVLIDTEQAATALEDTRWLGRDLGKFGVWNSGRIDNGLTATERGVDVEFFVHARQPAGAAAPVIEISHPFLWYWDAVPTTSGWKYLNEAGRDQDLVRWEITGDSWRVEVRALEFRHFLATYQRHALIQLDWVPKRDSEEFDRVDGEFHNEWAHVDFHVLHDMSMINRPAFSRTLGQYLVTGLRNSRTPRWEERENEVEHPSFIYGIDPASGEPLTHICDPDQLGTYFDKDGTRLHYLTPVYFKREVLQPYAAEPSRYRISNSRLSCLSLWGVEISFNSTGLVEVYLGDIGQKLPADEWGHWRTYNVPPEGKMDEGRFRRDFLNQWAGSNDPVHDLRKARKEAMAASQALLGKPLRKELNTETQAEFDSLIGPLTDDPAALGAPLLLLTKVLADGIEPAPLKAYLTDYEPGERSLSLLRRFTQELGGTTDITAIMRELQSFRSKGGIAHLAGSSAKKARAELEIEELTNLQAFESITTRITSCLNELTTLITQKLEQGAVNRPGFDGDSIV